MDNGNGALMRIFPFSMYCIVHNLSEEETLAVIRKAAGITHRHEINAMSCYIYTLFLDECIRTRNPELAYRNAISCRADSFSRIFSAEAVRAHQMLCTDLTNAFFDPDSIKESGYVVDSLMTAVYCILHTDCYEDAVKMAVNFGYDTDTNAAITGSVAGAMYGQTQIPSKWMNRVKKTDLLTETGRRFSGSLSDRNSEE